jgi:TPR repeat protein
MGQATQTIVVKRRGSTGVLAGVLGCLFGAFGIVTLGIVFVPLAALCSAIGLLRGLAGLSGSGIAVSLLGGVLTILGFVFSPSLWFLAGGLLVASQAQEPTAPSTSMVAMTDEINRAIPAEELDQAELLRRAADQGDAEAQNNLGIMYENGSGVPQNYATAVMWYRKAADQGDAKAQTFLGVMYENGSGVPQNYATAVMWYRKAADQGLATAQYNLATMFEYGVGVPKDNAKAVSWYRKAADQGDADAKNNLAALYSRFPTLREEYRAWKLAEENARRADARAEAAIRKMEAIEKADQRAETVPAKTRAAVKAEQEAAFKADTVARETLRAAQAAVPAEAMTIDDLCDFVLSLKTTYQDGQTTFHGYESRGVPALEAIAQTGNALAERCLGGRYSEVEKDVHRAMEMYRRAIDHGDEESMVRLGYLYREVRNCDAAMAWFKRAAATSKQKVNVVMAKVGLGHLYGGGKDNCDWPGDVVQQYAWYDAAAGGKLRTDARDQMPKCLGYLSVEDLVCAAASARWGTSEIMTDQQIAAARVFARGR